MHAGSAVGEDRYEAALRQLHERLLPVLDGLPDDGPRLLIEPTAGGGKSLAATVEDLGPYLAALENHPLVGVCFDTCHAWAAGHDLSVPGGMTATLDALEAAVGPGRLGLVHANDSLDECGSKRDRHTTIGAGSIGAAPFGELLAHPSMAGVPVVVETPERAGRLAVRRAQARHRPAVQPARPRLTRLGDSGRGCADSGPKGAHQRPLSPRSSRTRAACTARMSRRHASGERVRRVKL